MSDPILKEIQEAVKNIRYGSVEIVIHDSKIVQIERKEKLRFKDEALKPRADRTSGSSA